MKFLADEGVDKPVVEILRSQGFDVIYVAEVAHSISDDEVLAMANASESILLTADKDFGELVHRLGRLATGIILLRMPRLAPMSRAQRVMSAVERHGYEFMGAFTVIGARTIRIRRISGDDG